MRGRISSFKNLGEGGYYYFLGIFLHLESPIKCEQWLMVVGKAFLTK